MVWRRLSGLELKDSIVNEVEQVLIAEKDNKIKVCIGSDSQVKGAVTEFATVIVFLRQGKGGFFFLSKYLSEVQFSLKQRMIQEVSDSVQIAYELCELLDRYGIELEVHADINTDPQFKSNVAFKEAMGYIMGMGYTFKAKPDAFASSYCAGMLVK